MATMNRTQRREAMRQQKRRAVVEAGPQRSVSPQKAPAPSRWQGSQAGDRANAEALDGFAPLRNMLRTIAAKRGDWAGIPMPLEGERLVIEPSYPNAQALMAMCGEREEDPEQGDVLADSVKIRNSFWSVKKSSDIFIFEQDGKIDWGIHPGANHLTHDLKTLGCSEAWGIEQESNALDLLGTLIEHRRLKQYLLTGSFLESSKRSGVTYMFRRLKPTVAIGQKAGKLRIMCALCMHPIGHYAGSWAGAMTPTDDVVAHLMLMRGDEPMYWKRATQHAAWRPEAGV